MSTTSSPMETRAFQAEVRQLLDIVIHSLYTDRDIFLRELISNASDALEKARHDLLTAPEGPDREVPLQVQITIDKEAGTLAISDTGIGMTRDDMVENLGTIARSGTKQFLKEALAAAKTGDINLIGQFGVGFYSSFMVADRVVVESLSLRPGAEPARWESTADGEYAVGHGERTTRGTTVTLHLKQDAQEFLEAHRIKDVVHRFSSFVPFPVEMDGARLNTIQAIWTRSKNDVTDEEYTEFYKFVANAYDKPRMHLHFSADAPLAINALLFVPASNFEKLGFGRSEPGVDLYCRKVLIDKGPEKLLPEWMRFLRGVIDSDDLPLNISRESMQDSALVRKLSRVITNRFIKFLEEESHRDAKAYQAFFEEFGRFIKEGITLDHEYREKLAKLLRFETSRTTAGELTSFADYLTRMVPGQEQIVYINGPSREAIEAGPYVEALREHGYEVIYTFDPIDDYVFDNLREFEEKSIISADSSDLKTPELEKKDGEELTAEQAEKLCAWIKEKLGARIGTVRASKRLVNNPAVVVMEGMTASMQRLMAAMSKSPTPLGAGSAALEINPRHPLMVKLAALADGEAEFAGELTEQLFDNAMLAAGLLQDPRAMVDRLNRMLSRAAGV